MWRGEQEGLFTVFLDEGDCFLRIACGDGGILLDAVLDYAQVAHEGKRDLLTVHVVAIGNPEVRIESMVGGHEVGMVTEVPLPNAGGGVSLILEDFRNRSLAWVETFTGGRKKDAQVFLVHVHVDASWVATGHQA